MKLIIDLEDEVGWDDVSVSDTLRDIVKGAVQDYIRKATKEALKQEEGAIKAAAQAYARSYSKIALNSFPKRENDNA